MEGKKDIRESIFLSSAVIFPRYIEGCHGNPPIMNTFGGPDGLAGV